MLENERERERMKENTPVAGDRGQETTTRRTAMSSIVKGVTVLAC
jgi:hypothetical protein